MEERQRNVVFKQGFVATLDKNRALLVKKKKKKE